MEEGNTGKLGSSEVSAGNSRTSDRCEQRYISIQETVAELARWGGAEALDRICREVTHELGVLVDHSLLLEQSLARVAAGLERGAGELEEKLIKEMVLRAVDMILSQDYQDLKSGRREVRAESTRDRFVVQGMGFHPDMAHVVAVRYNRMHIRTRRVFAAVLVRHEPPEEVFQREGGWASAQEMVESLFDVIQMLRDPEVSPS